MDANAILDKLQADAKEAAAATLADAGSRAAMLRTASDERIQEAKAKIIADAEADAKAQESRMRRMAELEERKRLLADKRAVMDMAFSEALERLKAMPDEQVRAWMTQVLLSAADGDETLIPGAEHMGWLNASFIAEANAQLEKAGKKGQIALGGPALPGEAGFVLMKGEIEVRCTFAALLDAQRIALEADVAAILFPDAD